jgi:hypothetical protein
MLAPHPFNVVNWNGDDVGIAVPFDALKCDGSASVGVNCLNDKWNRRLNIRVPRRAAGYGEEVNLGTLRLRAEEQ